MLCKESMYSARLQPCDNVIYDLYFYTKFSISFLSNPPRDENQAHRQNHQSHEIQSTIQSAV